MNVTLCQPASQYIHSSLAPWYLKAAARALCRTEHAITVVDGTVNEAPDALARRLCAGAPDLIGLSCYIWNISRIKQLLPVLRAALPRTVIALGGPEVSFSAETVLADCPEVDFILCGEGEISFSALLDSVESGNISAVPGLCRRGEAGPTFSAAPAPLGKLFNPYTDEYFASLRGRICYIETTRGCPFSCAYCLSGRADRLRRFDLDAAFDALLKLANSGSKTVKFVDRTFNADEPRALRIWRFLAEKRAAGEIPASVCFHFEVAADLFSPACLAYLKTVPQGLFQFEAGLQSFHQETLAAVQRKTDADELCANLLSILSGGNIHLHVDLIAGLPYEGLSTFSESFDRAYALGAHQLQLGFLKLIYGSTLRGQAADYGMTWDALPPYEITATRWLSAADLKLLNGVEAALGRLSNSGRFVQSLPYLLSLWQGGAFAFFSAFAAFSADLPAFPGADEVGERFYRFGCAIAGIKPERLRDLLAVDTLASRRLGRLPDFLKVPDARLRAVNTALKTGSGHAAGLSDLGTKFTAGKLSFCLLYSGVGCCGGGETLALFNYTRQDPVTGLYPVCLVPLAEFLPSKEQ